MTQQKLVTATYKIESKWVLDRDIDTAFYWYVKWDLLHVMWNEGDSVQTYEPDSSGSGTFDYKRPNEVNVEKIVQWLY